VARDAVDDFTSSLPPAVLRVKGRVRLDDDTWVLVQVVGRRCDVTPCAPAGRSQLVAIAGKSDPPVVDPFALHFG
jgi:G3E family GTPase